MSELDDSFARLLGRQPSDAERQQLYQVRDALDLKNNDALWLVLMALQYHHYMYARFPDLIKQAANETLRDFQQAADATFSASKEQAKAELAKAVSAVAQDVARLTARKQAAIWITTCLLACCTTFGAFGWYVQRGAYSAGYEKGYGKAYIDSRDEKATASWANTPQGKAAYRLAQAGDIDSLIRCDLPGWKIQQGICYVHPARDGSVYGWGIPSHPY